MGVQGKRLVINPELCTGCLICELICSFSKFRRFNPLKSALRIEFNYELSRLEGFNVCSQCGACITSCPVNAISRVDGIVVIDHGKCIGCLTCISKCPTSSIYVVNGKPYKCDLCRGTPICVKYCVRGALNVV